MIHVPRCRVDPTCRFAPGQLRFHEHRTRLRLAALVILYVTSLPAMKLPYYYPCCMQTQLHLLKSHVFCWPLWYLSCQPFCNNISNKNPVNKAVTVLSSPCLAEKVLLKTQLFVQVHNHSSSFTITSYVWSTALRCGRQAKRVTGPQAENKETLRQCYRQIHICMVMTL